LVGGGREVREREEETVFGAKKRRAKKKNKGKRVVCVLHGQETAFGFGFHWYARERRGRKRETERKRRREEKGGTRDYVTFLMLRNKSNVWEGRRWGALPLLCV
jgi:hypothetical protein